MSTQDNGGPAFPVPGLHNDADFNGMSLRDYFAAKALQGMLTTSGAPALNGLDGFEKFTAKAAYLMADEMLKARGQ